jgi:RES domain-containing protein
VTLVYRLVRRERAAEALSGEGARRYGGRWNPPGAAVVYAAESRALISRSRCLPSSCRRRRTTC